MYDFIAGIVFVCLASLAVFLWLAARAPVMDEDNPRSPESKEPPKPRAEGADNKPRAVNE